MRNDGRLDSADVQRGSTLLAVFAKCWEPGRVKTRLAAAIGSGPAADLHRQFVAVTLARLATLADCRWLAGSPDEALPQFRELAAVKQGNWSVVPQSRGDLGRRMRRLFQAAFATGCQRAVLIGSDSPDLPVERVEQAFNDLADVPVVIGPSADGGYYLIGASRTVPPIFDDMPWSSPSLRESTTRRLKQEGIGFSLLEPWRDVDDYSDLAALYQRLTHAARPVDAPLAQLRTYIEGWIHALAAIGART